MSSQPTSTFVEDPKLPSLRVVATYTACIYSVMVWDWIVNLKREYKYIWRSKPTFVSGVYVILRYWTMIKFAFSIWLSNTNMTVAECSKWSSFQVFGNLPLTVSISALLSWRLYAMYGQNRILLAALATCIAAMVAVIVVASFQFGPPPPFITGSGPCFAGTKPHATRLRISLWMAPFVFDLLSTALLIGRIVVIRRRGASRGGILQVLVRDGLVYFGVISCVNLINVGFLLGAAKEIQTVNAGMAFMVSATAACRLVLSLRDHAEMELSALSSAGRASGVKSQGEANGIVTFSRPTTGNKAGFGISKINANFSNQNQQFEPTHIALDTFGNTGLEKGANDDLSSDDGVPVRGNGSVPGVFVVSERHTRVDVERH